MDESRQYGFHSLTDTLAATMARVQQGLLARGYRYLDGDPAHWPLSAVLMANGDDILLVCPWPLPLEHLREVWENLHRRMKAAGLLLVGTAAPDDAKLNALWQAVDGTVAYLDAGSGRMSVRRAAVTPEALREDILGALFSGCPADVADIDPARELRADLEHRREERALAPGATGVPRPYVTYGIIALCVVIFLASVLGGGTISFSLSNAAAVKWGALVPSLVHAGEWWRLLTSGFLHANLLHIGFNMFALYSLGTMLEHWQGRARFAALFLFSVLTSALVALWFSRLNDVTLGASGGIFGLLGGFIAIAALYWKEFPKPVRKQLFGWIPQVLLINGLISLMPGVSLAGHAGGLLGGLLIGLVIMRSPVRRNPLPAWAWVALIALLAATGTLAHYVIGSADL